MRQSAATLYPFDCMGCHLPPEVIRREAPFLVGQFAQTERGRVFFIHVPDTGGKPLGKQQDARLLREILNWKKSCPIISQESVFCAQRRSWSCENICLRRKDKLRNDREACDRDVEMMVLIPMWGENQC